MFGKERTGVGSLGTMDQVFGISEVVLSSWTDPKEPVICSVLAK